MDEMSIMQKPTVTQNKNLHFTFNSNNNIKANEDYDLVIKQFDDLILELSNKETIDDKSSNSNNLFDIIQENMKMAPQSSDVANFKSNNTATTFTKELMHTKKLPTNNHISTNKYNGVKSKLESADESSIILEESLDKTSCKCLNEYSVKKSLVIETDKSISWINSNLWHVENDKNISRFQKPTCSKNKEYLPTTDHTIDSKGFVSCSSKSINPFEYKSILNQTNTLPQMKDQTAKYSYNRNNPKHCTSFSHNKAYFKGASMYESSLQFQRVKPNLWSHVTLDKSPKMSRHLMHKHVSDNFMVNLFIETKNSHLGPFTFEIYLRMTLRLLKLKVQKEYGIPMSSQRWILDKYFAVDNDKSLVEYHVLPGSAIILYVDSKCALTYNAERVETTSFDSCCKTEMSVTNRTPHNEENNTTSNSHVNKSENDKIVNLARDFSISKDNEICIGTNSLCDTAIKEICNSDLYDSESEHKFHITSVGNSPAVKKKYMKKDLLSKEKEKIKSFEKQVVLNTINMKKPEFQNSILSNSSETPPPGKNKSSHTNMLQAEQISQSENALCDNSEKIVADDSLFNQMQSTTIHGAVNDYFSCKEPKDLKLAEFPHNIWNNDLQTPRKDIVQNPTYSGISSTANKEVTKADGDNQGKNEDTINYSSTSKCNIESIYDVKDSQSGIQSNVNLIQTVEKSDDLQNNIHVNSSHNSKRPVISILRRLSMRRKANSEDDSNNSDSINMLEVHNVENTNDSDSCIKKSKYNFQSGMQISHTNPEKCNIDDNFIKMDNDKTTEPRDFPVHNSILEHAVTELHNSTCSHDMLQTVKTTNENDSSHSSSSIQNERYILSESIQAEADDESSSSEDMSFLTVQSDAKMEEKDNRSASVAYHSSFNDINIEIFIDPEIIPTENVDISFKEETLVDPVVSESETIKNLELLLEIENMDLVENTMNFTCPVCFEEFESGQGIVLHDCLHTFCRDCLSNSVIHAEGALIKCPYFDDSYSCQSYLQQREIKALVSEDEYEKYLQRSIMTAEGLAERSFHCKTPDCPGWCIYDNIINIFHCPVCNHFNCLNCQAIHEGLNCRQYQEKLKIQQRVDQDAEKTLQFLNKMIENGKALRCPKCDLILMKKWGCDWLKCSVCKTEICWITRGPRWGPGGQGDTSGGCRCGVNGVKCHPSCTYCH